MKLLVLLLGAEAAVLALEVAHRGVRTLSVVEGFPHLTGGRNFGEGQGGMAQEASLGWSRLDDALAAPPCLAAYANALAVALSCNPRAPGRDLFAYARNGANEDEIRGTAHSFFSWRSSRPLLDPIAAGAACVIPSGRRLPPVRDDESRRKSSYGRRHASRHRVAHRHGRPHRF